MKVLRNALLLILALLVQTSYLDEIAIKGIRPDLVLLLLVYISIVHGQIPGTIFGFLAGLLQDVYSPAPLGLNALCKSIIGFLVGYTRGGIIEESLLARGFIIFGATIFHDLVYFLIFSWKDLRDYFTLILRYTLPAAAYTTLVGVILFQIASFLSLRLGRILGNRSRR